MIENGILRKENIDAEKRSAALAAVALAVEEKRLKLENAINEKERQDNGGGESGAGGAWWGRAHPPGVEVEVEVRMPDKCPDCEEEMKPTRLRAHLLSFCPYRIVYCTNRPMGCKDELPLALLQLHLQTECKIEIKKDEMVQKSNNKELFLCPGCSLEIPMTRYKRHQKDSCINRKVPCKNCKLGCRVMVRPNERERHEFVDSSAGGGVRSCLYLAGQGSHLLLVSET